eukprot:586079-Amphidinium_carterae.2
MELIWTCPKLEKKCKVCANLAACLLRRHYSPPLKFEWGASCCMQSSLAQRHIWDGLGHVAESCKLVYAESGLTIILGAM